MNRSAVIIFLGILSSSLFFEGCSSFNPEPVLDQSAQLKVDTALIGNYVRSKGISTRADINGIRFQIITLGTGRPPQPTDEVEIEYTGKFLDGKVFDSGNINQTVGGFIRGFAAGLQLLPEGSTANIFIPSVFAYGATGASGIPKNSNLIFNVKLNKIVLTKEYLSQLATDTVLINSFLQSNNITGTFRDQKSGLRILITQQGSGPNADWYDAVKINYTGKLLSGEIVQSGTAQPSENFNSWVANYLPMFQIGLRNMKAGSKATLYTPSGLAFGKGSTKTAFTIIPPDTNLIYELELVALNP